MSAISLKSITGITSITTPAGVDNQLTLHNNNTTEAVKLDVAGNLHFHNHLNITGVSTASNFKTGTSNLHNTGLNVQDLDVDRHTNLDNVSIAGVTTMTGALTISSTTDQMLNLNSSDNNGTSLAFQRNNSRQGYIGYGGASNGFIIANETINGPIAIQGNDGGSIINMLSFATDNKGLVTLHGGATIPLDLDVDGHTNLDNVSIAGVATATTFVGNLTGNVTGNISGGTVAGSTGTFSGDVSITDKIVHTDDTNTAIRFLANDTISFETSGSERLRMDLNGNLNIGATGSGNASVYARHILISGSSNQGMTIHTTDTSGVNRKCCLFFGTGTSVADMADGMLFYDHAGQYMHFSTAGAGVGITKSSIRLASDGTVRFDSTPTTTNSISLLIKSHKARAVGDNNGIVFRDANDHAQAGINVTKQSTSNAASDLVFRTSDGAVTTTLQGIPERLRIGRAGQIGIAGANYGTARQTIVSNGSSSAVSWSSNPFLLDMDSLGDVDYDGVFLRYREVNVNGNGIVHLGLCKSTTNCPAGRIGCPVGFIPGVVYNSQFRVDKVGITPWPDTSGHRYEYFAVISDFTAAGKLGIFYLTNTTN